MGLLKDSGKYKEHLITKKKAASGLTTAAVGSRIRLRELRIVFS